MAETIGQQLKRAREARHLTFKQVTESTHIQARLIEAMEADEFESLPSPVQARAFLRLYAQFLGLSLDELIGRQRASAEEPPTDLQSAFQEPYPDQGLIEDTKVRTSARPADRTQRQVPRSAWKRKLQDFTFRKKRSASIEKEHSSSIESREQIPPSEDEGRLDKPFETNEVENEIPIQGEEPELLPSGDPSSQSRSHMIFTNIGRALRDRREALSLSLDEIEDHTHVRKHYLQALEEGNFGHLPSSVQTRGMLNNYAHFLDMDMDAILLSYAEGLQTQRLERQAAQNGAAASPGKKSPSTNTPSPNRRRYFSMDVVVGVGLVLFLLLFAIWGSSRVIGLRLANTPEPTTQPISDILALMPEVGTTTPVDANNAGNSIVVPAESPTAIVTLPPIGQGPVQVVLIAFQQAYVRVTADGKKVFDGRVTAGTAYPFDGNSQIEVLTGNGAALSIVFNQSDLGRMGGIGEVVNRIYTANAILEPTATLTPSPTITPTPTVTPRPSATPRPGSTPRNPAATREPG